MEEDPAVVDEWEAGCLLAGVEGRDQAQKETDWKNEDAEGDGFVSPVDQQESDGEEEAEESLGLVGIDGKTVMGSVEHLSERDKVEEDGSDSSGDGDMTPTRAVVEGGGQNGKRGYAVEEDRDSEPEERHRIGSAAQNCRTLSISGSRADGRFGALGDPGASAVDSSKR